ncbi:MAG: TRAP transporter substrate-binding protein DctP [Actinomycetales bacterium]
MTIATRHQTQVSAGSRKGLLRRGIGLLAGCLILIAGCADQSPRDAQSAGEGIEYGADKQAYIDALADMEPVTLTLQSSAPKGAATGRRFEEYAAAVQDWSGGKITFDIAFANAIAPPAEVDDALADGRIDVGSVLPMLDPAEFPANGALWEAAVLGRQTPVDGMLQWHGAVLQAAAGQDEFYTEFEDRGITLLLPVYHSGSFGYMCRQARTDLPDLAGATIATQSLGQAAEARALGMNPVTITYAEMFESLQRGVVDCTASTFTVAVLGGFIPEASHVVIDPEVGWAIAGGAIAVNKQTWDGLPLAAQQLMYDRLDVLLRVNFESTWDNVQAGLDEVSKAGGSVSAPSPEVRDALEAANNDILKSVADNPALSDGAGFVDELRTDTQAWQDTVAELDLGQDVSYQTFPEWYTQTGGKPDLDSYFDTLWSEAMADRRPQ